MKRKKVLLVYVNYSGFVEEDDKILSSLYEVIRYRFKPVKGIFHTTLQMLRQLFYLVFHLPKVDFMLIWFADTHAFLPVLAGKLFRVPTAIVIGGFDAVSLPGIGYGLYCSNRIRRFFAVQAAGKSTYLLPVDASLIEYTNYYADLSGKGLPVGIRKFAGKIRGKIITLPTGYDPESWKENPDISRSGSVVTVASIPNMQRWVLKGCDLLQDAAAMLPGTGFHIYGLSDSFLTEMNAQVLPANFHLHGTVKPADLTEIYSSHKIYAQFSLSEGLPNALCEAMLCGCIPVGSDVNGIPAAIGDKRLIISRKDANEAVKVIQFALSQNMFLPGHFRNRIISRFPAENRIEVFSDIIK